jgi:hypothetical protein
MPDSTFKILNPTLTIPAGKYLDTFWMIVYPNKIDPTQNYMAPVQITDASGNTISANFSTIYFHTIGNPIAGAYTWDYSRWNKSDTLGAVSPGVGSFTGESTTFLPDNPTQVEVSTGYGATVGFSLRYVITFDNNGGVISNIAVALNPDDVASMGTNRGITVTAPAKIVVADPVAGLYRFTFGVYNGSAYRSFVDYFYK